MLQQTSDRGHPSTARRRGSAARVARGSALLWPLLCAVLLGGCPATGGLPRGPGAAAGDGVAAADRVTVETGSVRSSTGCDLGYSLYRPAGSRGPAVVVLSHGFLRSRERMSDLARRLAGHGMPTATLDLCNMRPWDGAHRQNGADMRRLARHLGEARVLYAGFSAGGLAALVAASQDPGAVGVLAMDLVDRDRLGEGLASGLQRPLVGLVGDPSRCNAQGSGLAVYAAAPDARVVRVPGATHCDFESPTDGLCRFVCEDGERPVAVGAALREAIIGIVVDACRELLGAAGVAPAVVRRPTAGDSCLQC